MMVYGQILHRHGRDDCSVNLNVGGFKQRVERDVLRRFPQTRLGRLLCCSSNEAILELCDDFSPSEMEYYFDRNPSFFCYVLNFYLTGKMHLMDGLCVASFNQEIEYWGIKERHLDSCCREIFQELNFANSEEWEQLQASCSSIEEKSQSENELEMFEGSWCEGVRKSIWLRLENPGYSRAAKMMAVASMSVVVVSILAMCVHSMPEYHVDVNGNEVETPELDLVEMICVIFFSVEFVVRFAVAPSVKKFLCNILNIIDFISIIPFYITLVLDLLNNEEELADLENVGKVVQILRLMRMFRILKLARHSAGLQSLGATFRGSYREVGLLILFLSVGTSIFAVLMYFVENESLNTTFHSIPIGYWWATISMTTVGYGDMCPVTPVGKLVATLCILSGMLVVALPITLIFNKFAKFYQRQNK